MYIETRRLLCCLAGLWFDILDAAARIQSQTDRTGRAEHSRRTRVQSRIW